MIYLHFYSIFFTAIFLFLVFYWAWPTAYTARLPHHTGKGDGTFGSSWEFGCCRAKAENRTCGYPLLSNGSCLNRKHHDA